MLSDAVKTSGIPLNVLCPMDDTVAVNVVSEAPLRIPILDRERHAGLVYTDASAVARLAYLKDEGLGTPWRRGQPDVLRIIPNRLRIVKIDAANEHDRCPVVKC